MTLFTKKQLLPLYFPKSASIETVDITPDGTAFFMQAKLTGSRVWKAIVIDDIIAVSSWSGHLCTYTVTRERISDWGNTFKIKVTLEDGRVWTAYEFDGIAARFREEMKEPEKYILWDVFNSNQ